MAVETVVIRAPEVTTEDPAHVAAMIAKADGGTAPVVETPGATGERPSWLPEKFKTAEDMAKAYGALESKLGGTPPVAGDPPVAPVVPPSEASTEQAAAELQSKGLDLGTFSQEFAESGALSAESYTKLQDAGYPKQFVDDYIAGQTARSELFVAGMKAEIGGEDNFSAMSTWAAATLSAGELAAYNAAIDSRNPEQSKLAVLGMYQKFTTARPVEPSLIGGGGGGSAADVYESNAQVKADMRDPKYKADPAFRAKVAAKIGRSSNVL